MQRKIFHVQQLNSSPFSFLYNSFYYLFDIFYSLIIIHVSFIKRNNKQIFPISSRKEKSSESSIIRDQRAQLIHDMHVQLSTKNSEQVKQNIKVIKGEKTQIAHKCTEHIHKKNKIKSQVRGGRSTSTVESRQNICIQGYMEGNLILTKIQFRPKSNAQRPRWPCRDDDSEVADHQVRRGERTERRGSPSGGENEKKGTEGGRRRE